MKITIYGWSIKTQAELIGGFLIGRNHERAKWRPGKARRAWLW
jgi:hypothetical protein